MRWTRGPLRVTLPALLAVALCPATAVAQGPTVTITSPLNDSASANPTPTFEGTTEDPFDEVSLVIYEGSTVAGNLVQTLTASPLLESWSAGPPATLPDGTYTAQVSQNDTQLEPPETGLSEPVTFTVDTVAPAVSLDPVATPTNDPAPTFEGAAGNAPGDLGVVRLDVYSGTVAGGTPVRTLEVTRSGGAWATGPVSPLPDGTYTVQAEQSDEAGNKAQSDTATFTVDTVAPLVSLATVPSPGSDATPAFSGGAGVASGDVQSVKLNIYSGSVVSGSPVQTLQATPLAGAWSTAPLTALADGTYTAQAEQSDEAGNVGLSAPVTFRIDTTPPAITLTAPVDGGWTSSESVLVQGAAGTAQGDSGSVTVELYAGSSIGAQAPEETIVKTVSKGHWSATFGELSDGTYTVRAEQSDETGNVGRSNTATFTVDTVAPLVSLAPVPSPSSDATPAFSGTAGGAPGDVQSVKLNIYSGSDVSGSPVQSLPATPLAGAWSTAPATVLADGTYTAQAEQSDQAGNTGRSTAVTFTIKTKGPKVTLTALPKYVNVATPTFGGNAGTANGDSPHVILNIYSGATTSGSPLQQVNVTAGGGVWSSGPSSPLTDGTYTAQAEQSDNVGDTIQSVPSTFTIDTHSPFVSLAAVPSPSSDSTPSFTGGAGVATGDIATVTLKIYPGSVVSGGALRTLAIPASGDTWSAGPVAALEDGTYTAQAEQSDEAGNLGISQPVKFTISTPPVVTPEPVTTPTPTQTQPPTQTGDSPPAASFTWFPLAPKVGESVELVSNSTDTSSPIATQAWSLSGGPFNTGGSTLGTTFSSAGQHVVRLRVTAADGLSSTVSETIIVHTPHASLMQPFPIVRIAGSDSARGAKVTLLAVQAPSGAKITVSCHGGGCPGKPQSRTAGSARTGLVVIEFHRFERSLRAGATLEVRVSKPGEIGKYTRFRIRRNKLPERLDSCLSPTTNKPMGCPS